MAHDIGEIIANCASTHWADRKDGLIGLQYYFRESRYKYDPEISQICLNVNVFPSCRCVGRVLKLFLCNSFKFKNPVQEKNSIVEVARKVFLVTNLKGAGG
jgi:hypothetical protein